MSSELVYSTGKGRVGRKDKRGTDGGALGSGPIKMRLETKGRGGKAVTVLFNLPMNTSAAKELKKDLQGYLGCGSSFKDGRIELQGDHRDKIEAFFRENGTKVVRAGG